MTGRVFVKDYDDPDRCAAARRHLAWLDGLDSGVRLPRPLEPGGARRLVLEHLDGPQPGPERLGDLAEALGRLHAAAYRRQLHRARLDRPFPAGDLVIADFVAPRGRVLRKVPVDVAGLPAAFYKDANIRNFLLTSDGVAVVDPDTLTLAPFGYDLAKLVVSTVMTHGPLRERAIAAALDAYNARVGPVHELALCTRSRLDAYARIHDVLTRPYLHRNGYRFVWPHGRRAPDSRSPATAGWRVPPGAGCGGAASPSADRDGEVRP